MFNWMFYISIPLGLVSGLLHLQWGYAVLLFWAWFLLKPERRFVPLKPVSQTMIFLYILFVVWTMTQTYLVPFFLQDPIRLRTNLSLFLFVYFIVMLFHRNFQWRFLKEQMTGLLLAVTAGWLICHILLCLWAGIWFEFQSWLHYSIVFLLLNMGFQLHSPKVEPQLPTHLNPILIVLIACTLFGHYVRSIQLENAANRSSEYRMAMHHSIQSGYIQTAIQALLNEGARLAAQNQTQEALTFMRSQWEHLPKEQIAEAYRNHSTLSNNPFLFLSLFGGRLRLNPEEEILDGLIAYEPLQYIVLTNQNRVVKISGGGISGIILETTNAARIHFDETKNVLYGMAEDQNVFMLNENEVSFIPLPRDEGWVDAKLSSTEGKLRALHARGGIVEYTIQDEAWKYARELYPPLWREEKLAIQLLHETINGQDVFYVLDKHKGITARYPANVSNSVLPKKDLFRFYHPERRNAVGMNFYKDQIVIAGQFGRLDFVSEGVGDDFTEWKYSIRAPIYFDQTSGLWLRNADTVALITCPPAETIILLKRNGIFEPVAMPQGFRLVSLKRNGWWDATSTTISTRQAPPAAK